MITLNLTSRVLRTYIMGSGHFKMLFDSNDKICFDISWCSTSVQQFLVCASFYTFSNHGWCHEHRYGLNHLNTKFKLSSTFAARPRRIPSANITLTSTTMTVFTISTNFFIYFTNKQWSASQHLRVSEATSASSVSSATSALSVLWATSLSSEPSCKHYWYLV